MLLYILFSMFEVFGAKLLRDFCHTLLEEDLCCLHRKSLVRIRLGITMPRNRVLDGSERLFNRLQLKHIRGQHEHSMSILLGYIFHGHGRILAEMLSHEFLQYWLQRLRLKLDLESFQIIGKVLL